MKILTLWVVALLAGGASAASLQGPLGGDTTWDAAGGPYLLTGDVTVPAGVTLTVEPGAVVIAAASDGLGGGADSARVELIVQGTLRVRGTDASPATFKAESAGAGTWSGIRVEQGTTSSVSGALIRDAVTGLQVTGASSALAIDHSQLTANTRGVSNTGATLSLTHSLVVSNASDGVSCLGACTLDYDTLAFNGGSACVLDTRSGGVKSSMSVSNSIVSDNLGSVVSNPLGLPMALSYNVVFHNGEDNRAAATHSLFFNPLFVSASIFRITTHSPARFAASDGSSDVGALPYAGDPTPATEGYLQKDTTFSGDISLAGDLVVPPNIVLTLAPGTTLTASATDGLKTGQDTGRVELIVQGTLKVMGTDASPVTLKGASAGAGAWYGIRVEQGTSTLSSVLIRDALRGLEVTTRDGSGSASHVTVTSSTFTSNSSGAVCSGGILSIESSLLSSNGVGAALSGSSNRLTIINSLVSSNGDGITSSDDSELDVERSRVVSNSRHGVSCSPKSCILGYDVLSFNGGDGVKLDFDSASSSSSASVRGCIITSNNNYGVYSGGRSPDVSLAYNDVWGNRIDYGDLYYTPANSLSVDPLFVSATNLHLQPPSACVGAGEFGMSLGAYPDYKSLARLVLTPGTSSVQVGASQAFSVVGLDSDGQEVSISPTWSVVSGGGSVSSSGLFTAGTLAGSYPATLQVSVERVKASASIEVTPGPFTRLRLTPSHPSLPSSATLRFAARAEDTYGNETPSEPFSWSALPAAGTISSSGVFTAGPTAGDYANAVTVSASGVSASTDVRISGLDHSVLDHLTITPSRATLQVGRAQVFSVVGVDSAGREVPITPTWSVVAGGGGISSTGLFTADTTVGSYDNTVQVSVGSVKASASIQLLAGPVYRVVVSPSHPTLAFNGSQTFTARAEDAYGNKTANDSDRFWTALYTAGIIRSSSGVFTAGATPGDYPNAVKVTVEGVSGSASVHVSDSGTSTPAALGCGSSGAGDASTPLWALLLLGLGGAWRGRSSDGRRPSGRARA